MSRIQANTKVEVEYCDGTKKQEVLTLTGGKMQKVLTLQRQNLEQFVSNDAGTIPDLSSIPMCLEICIGDAEQAKDLWENHLTVSDAAEIIAGCIQASQASEDDKKK
tara:strand:+ start:495 stop:815 length:321 start_codon:yes stop_codon:yes gene_type:complete